VGKKDMAHGVETRYAVQLDTRGRLVLPSQLRERLHLASGDRVLLTLESDDVVRLESIRDVARRVRGMLHAPSGRRLSDELVAERRAEAKQEAKRERGGRSRR
jgi:AbrB family looped-hinge helix DNA binding protein